MTRRKKPSPPRKIEAANDDIRERRSEAKRLKAMGAEVVVGRDEAIERATILDAINMMERSRSITAEQAGHVRGLEKLVALANERSASCLSSLDRVGGSDVTSQTMRSIIRHTEAAKKLDRRRQMLSRITWALLRDLCDGNLLLSRWRQTVERHTGEKNDKAQAGILRQAIRDLEDVENQLVRCAANDRPQDDVLALAG